MRLNRQAAPIASQWCNQPDILVVLCKFQIFVIFAKWDQIIGLATLLLPPEWANPPVKWAIPNTCTYILFLYVYNKFVLKSKPENIVCNLQLFLR